MPLFTIIKRNIVDDSEVVDFSEARDLTEMVGRLAKTVKFNQEGIYVYNVSNSDREYKYIGIPFFARSMKAEREKLLENWVRYNLDVEPLDNN